MRAHDRFRRLRCDTAPRLRDRNLRLRAAPESPGDLRPLPDVQDIACFQGIARFIIRGCVMPRYGYACPSRDAEFDLERPVSDAGNPAICPACAAESPRAFSSPRLLFKADPRDNRPYWHNH